MSDAANNSAIRKQLEDEKKAREEALKPKKKPLIPNLFKIAKEKYNRERIETEKRLLKREEVMKQDIERFLMEIEDRRAWITHELLVRNYARLKREESLAIIVRKVKAKEAAEDIINQHEQGIDYFQGTIKSFSKWQNSPSKHFDIKGHTAAVNSCHLSKCNTYALTCSTDKSARIWKIETGKCILAYYGHGKRINDGELHPNFQIDNLKACVITCSTDKNIKIWNSYSGVCMKTLEGHLEAVYRCSFSADGNRIVSCSEDKTVRTWCFPDGYLLYIYYGHQSPVVSVSFSPTCRYIVSGSDYGERKILLWDTAMPNFDQAIQYGHMIFWNTAGTIKKILIRQITPPDSFWLTSEQSELLGEDAMVEAWPGENEPDIEMPDNSDDDSDDDEPVVDTFGMNDKRNFNGTTIGCVAIDEDGDPMEAVEYIPGSKLYITFASPVDIVTEVFISIHPLQSMFEIFDSTGGRRMGRFKTETPIPWEMDKAIIDPSGFKKPRRECPNGLLETSDGQALVYFQYSIDNDKGDRIIAPCSFTCAWMCPGPELGPATVRVNYKIQYDDTWHTLDYSLKESLLRMNSTDDKKDSDGPPPERFLFDQEARHVAFWGFIRDKNWEGVESVLDPKCVIYRDKLLRKRRWRVIDILERMFGKADGLVMPSPFVVRGGLTRSSVMIEAMPFKLEDSSSEEDDEDLEEDSDDDSEDDDDDDNGIEEQKIDEENVEGEKEENEEDDDNKQKVNDDELAEKLDKKKVDGTINEISSGKKSAKFTSDDEIVEEDGGGSGGNESGDENNEEGEVNKDDDDDDDDDEEENEEYGSEKMISTLAKIPEESNLDVEGDNINGEQSKFDNTADDGKKEVEVLDINGEKFIRDVSTPPVSSGLSFKKKEKVVEVEQVFVIRKKSHAQNLTEVIFLDDVDGPDFDNKVNSLANKEALHLLDAQNSKCSVNAISEVRLFPANPELVEDLKEMPNTPSWLETSLISFYKKQREGGDGIGDAGTNLSMSEMMGIKPINWFPVATHPLLKGNRFGPDIEQYTMDLPANYPKRAGKNLQALSDQLADYKNILIRMKKEGVPISMSDLIESSGPKKKMTSKEKKELLNKLKNGFREDVKIHLLAERTYVGTRRSALGSLPGMISHYPNSFYREPAIEVNSEEDDKKCVKPSFPTLFGSTVVTSFLVPPVGKKPKTFLEIEEELKALKEEEERILAEEIAELSIPQTPGSRPQTPSHGLVDANRPITPNRPATPNRATTPNHGLSTKGISLSILDGSERLETPGSNSGKSHKHRRHNRHEHEVEFEEIIVKEEPIIEEPIIEEEISEEQKLINKETDRRIKAGIPLDVYLGRRGSFPFSPGLESFALGVKGPLSHLANKKKDDEKSSAKDNNKIVKKNVCKGLLRNFTFNGFEVAHQGSVNDVVFSPSECRVVSAGGDGFIKIWDPRDGTYVRTLSGHDGEVMMVRYSADELFIVSTGADKSIKIWDLSVNRVIKTLRGHCDIITGLSISYDCSLMITASQDLMAKTWFLSPRRPDIPDAPRIISKTTTTVMLLWVAPPSFSLDLTAFFIEFRIGMFGDWQPREGKKKISVAPVFRSKDITDLIGATPYQFRIQAENKMGLSDWSKPSVIVDTLYGIPVKLERPTACKISRYSMTIYFFVPHPNTYGSAPRKFEIQVSGAGERFEDGETLHMELDDGESRGNDLLKVLREMIKPRKDLFGSHKLKEDPFAGYSISTLAINQILKIVEEDETQIFCALDIYNLHPGMMYRYIIRGINNAGPGPWSEGSYSTDTEAAPPDTPKPPFVAKAFLTSLLFEWYAPHNNGGAITGYEFCVQHTGKIFKLPRGKLEFLMENLQPGKSYSAKVKAINGIGETPFSDWSELKDGYTITERPSVPRNALALDATWDQMTLKCKLPYGNGAIITAMNVMRRVVHPFTKDEWEKLYRINIPSKDVVILNYVDQEEQQREVQMIAMRYALEAAADDYNPFKKKKAEAPNILTPEQEVAAYKPDGSTIKFTVKDLAPNTLYEFKMQFINKSGISDWSPPSHRAKTNRAEVPEVSKEPEIVEIMDQVVQISLHVPPQGGAPITSFTIEMRDLDEIGELRTEKHVVRDKKELLSRPLVFIEDLKKGGSFQFRSRAENIVGAGEFSLWSIEANTPEEVKIKKSRADASQFIEDIAKIEPIVEDKKKDDKKNKKNKKNNKKDDNSSISSSKSISSIGTIQTTNDGGDGMNINKPPSSSFN